MKTDQVLELLAIKPETEITPEHVEKLKELFKQENGFLPFTELFELIPGFEPYFSEITDFVDNWHLEDFENIKQSIEKTKASWLKKFKNLKAKIDYQQQFNPSIEEQEKDPYFLEHNPDLMFFKDELKAWREEQEQLFLANENKSDFNIFANMVNDPASKMTRLDVCSSFAMQGILSQLKNIPDEHAIRHICISSVQIGLEMVSAIQQANKNLKK